MEDVEVKSKAELAAEVVKLRSVKDEVVAEVERLTQELEQSKTRVVALENTVKLLQVQDTFFVPIHSKGAQVKSRWFCLKGKATTPKSEKD